MKFSTNSVLLAAAFAGMLGGTTARLNAQAAGDKNPLQNEDIKAPAGQKAPKSKKEKHDCKGKNSCKGKGGCSSSDNGCKGKNSCKGKGGCNTKGSCAPKQ